LIGRAPSQRYELKYLVNARQLHEFKRQTRGLLAPDEYNIENAGYYNYSVYFDSPQYRYYGEKREGLPERTKPRLRIYRSLINGEPLAQFFEFKNRQVRIVSKERVRISHTLSDQLLRAQGWSQSDELNASPILKRFYYLTQAHNLRPAISILYHRLAYRCPFGRKLRVTFDAQLKFSIQTGLDVGLSSFNYILPPHDTLIEVKFNDLMPMWLARIIENIQMQEESLSKYAMAVERCFSNGRRWWERFPRTSTNALLT